MNRKADGVCTSSRGFESFGDGSGGEASMSVIDRPRLRDINAVASIEVEVESPQSFPVLKVHLWSWVSSITPRIIWLGYARGPCLQLRVESASMYGKAVGRWAANGRSK